MKDLKVTIIQSPLIWENIEENLRMFSRKISLIKEEPDLIILPEMFSTGFTMNTRPLAEKMHGKTMLWMKQKAMEKECVIAGSIIVEEDGKYYNRLIWQRSDGTAEFYNKKHLFRYAGEQECYTAGNKKLIVDLHGWKICPMICYDLRFPVWIRNKSKAADVKSPVFRLPPSGYDVLIFVANWPEKRNHPWKILLQARAVENQCYVIGVNRIGTDGNNFSYSGDSMVLNPQGDIISKTKSKEESSETITFSKQELDDWRKAFPAWIDADEFDLLPSKK